MQEILELDLFLYLLKLKHKIQNDFKTPGVYVKKLFIALINWESYKARVILIVSHSHLSLMFAGKVAAYPSGAPYRNLLKWQAPSLAR